MVNKNEIPELCFLSIQKGDSQSITELKYALETHGFFSIINHGLSTKLIDRCYEVSKAFFDLDFQIKNKYSSLNSKGARGYTPIGIETAVGEEIPDQKEFWHHGPNINKTFNKKILKNINIEEINDFNKYFDELFLELKQCRIECSICYSFFYKPK